MNELSLSENVYFKTYIRAMNEKYIKQFRLSFGDIKAIYSYDQLFGDTKPAQGYLISELSDR